MECFVLSSFWCVQSVVNLHACSPSSFSAQRTGEPPQSAQDKARMDKEYLSLMAELGEAPVPSSGGGHSNNHGQRGSGQNNNQSSVSSTFNTHTHTHTHTDRRKLG